VSDEAAQQIFTDITDDFHHNEDVKQLLRLTDNMPLAVDLIAHLVGYEGCANVLARWETEKTSLFSAGNDRKSNLDASIRLSLSSPRITAGAKELLSLLSILPDGLSDAELLQSNLPIQNILGCKTALLATSLAYNDTKKRLRSLMPIREHVQQFSPPSQLLTHPLQKYFHSLLDLYREFAKYDPAQLGGVLNQTTLNLGNLQQVLYLGLHSDNPGLGETIRCIVTLSSATRITGQGAASLMDHIPAVLSHAGDHKLEVHFIVEVLLSAWVRPIKNPDLLIAQGISHCNHFNDPVLECESAPIQPIFIIHVDDNTSEILPGCRNLLGLLSK
jgi:hypothetical protein